MSTLEIWACLVSQMVKNLLAMQEMGFNPRGWEDLLEKRMAAQSGILAGEFHG